MPDAIEVKGKRTINLTATDTRSKDDCSIHSATMCPAFGSLRVTMRIEGVVPVLVGAVGCLYGLDFVSHFYGSSKPIVSPSLTPRELVQADLTDKVLDILRDLEAHEKPKMAAVMSLCTPETSGLHMELLPKRIGEMEIIPMRVPAYGVPTHPEAKDVAISQIVKRIGETYLERGERVAEDGLVAIGEVFPTDPVQLQVALSRLGIKQVAALPHTALPAYYAAPKAKVAALLHPFYERTVKELKAFGVDPLYSAPVGAEGTYHWFKGLGNILKLDPTLIEGVAQDEANKVADELDKNRLDGVKMLIAGYEGNELMFARLMHEAGAKILYVSTSVRNAPGTKIDQEWLEERGIEVLFRKRHEDDLEAIKEHKPDIVFGSSNLEAVAKRLGIPSVYYTNIVSARPILLSAGVRPLVEQVKLILSQQKIYASMRDFFADTN